MHKKCLIKTAREFIKQSKDNYISEDIAISEKVINMKIFEEPIFCFGSAQDEYFTLFKDPSIIGTDFLTPEEWLPGAKTVISFFLSYTEAVKSGEKNTEFWPSDEWLHGRIEGQFLVNKLCLFLQSEMKIAGYQSMVPMLDERFRSYKLGSSQEMPYTSNWSERHAAFVGGMGTFGLSKGLITPKGTAGRFGSLITELYIEPSKREYQDIYEYCTMCGACTKKCPAGAISMENGKNHKLCSAHLNETIERYKPRYGCGKCQLNVPCESRIPARQTSRP